MGRTFNGGSVSGGLYSGGSYLTSSTVPITDYPFTFAAWAKPVDATNLGPVMAFSRDTNTSHYLILAFFVDALYILAQGGGSSSAPFVSGAVDGTWQHVAAVFASSTSRVVYLNGTSASASTTVSFPTSLDHFYVGCEYRAARYTFEGDVAEEAVWNAALSASEIQKMYRGWSPELTRPDSLVHYSRLKRDAATEVDLIGTTDLTRSGTTATATHPTIVRQVRGLNLGRMAS